ncbi:MAG: PIN domain-containing protein [Acidimicrobiaceae bacterium]|nr:PIN domain-containing protein [Acidimicrobiaceae bacterium]
MLGASAILAFVQGEAGAAVVESALADDPRCSAVNWSEVAQKVFGAGRGWDLVRGLLLSCDIEVEPVTAAAEWAVRRWKPGEGLSLADRLCLALAERLDCGILTADRSWRPSSRVAQIR